MHNKKKLTIGFVSTFLPRECGIATYTDNLISAIKSAGIDFDYKIIALSNKKYIYSKKVKFVINQESDADYINAAEFINKSDIDVVSLQHEFNIFGGFNGGKLLLLLKNLKKPVVMTMHTVPIYQEKPFKIIPKRGKSRTKLLEAMLPYIKGITVMSEMAKDYIKKKFQYKGDIAVIPHGAPQILANKISAYQKEKQNLGFSKDDFVISTFGLISPQKGLEYVVRALPEIVKKYPNVNIKYLIAGKIHPNKPKQYLDDLKIIAKKNGVEKNLLMDSRYLSYDEIYRYLANTDIYITPYFRREQASSGTLSYAIAAGCCIVSTPYIFAYDLIKTKKIGELVKFKDTKSIITIITKLIKNRPLINKYKKLTYNYSQNIIWPKIAKNYIDFFKKCKD